MRMFLLAAASACALLGFATSNAIACDDRYPATCIVPQKAPQARVAHTRRPVHRRYAARKLIHQDAPPSPIDILKAAFAGLNKPVGRGGVESNIASGGLVTVQTAAGIPITVAASLADRFTGFIADLVGAGYKPRAIGCYARGGHIRGSNHYFGAACDIDQTGRDKTAAYMYHVSELTQKWGLTDGGDWRNPDHGHIEVSQHAENRSYSRRIARRPHYARAY